MIGEQAQGNILRIGKVVAVHPCDHSIDVVMIDNGARVAGVQVIAPTASTRSGRVDLPIPDMPKEKDQNGQPKDADKWSMQLSETQDLLAVVAMTGGFSVCLGFLYPQVNQLAMTDDTKNLAIERHASDFYTITTDDAVQTMCHPGGAYLSFGGEYYNMGHKDDDTGKKPSAADSAQDTPSSALSAAMQSASLAASNNITSLPDRTTADWSKVAIFAAHFDDEMIFMEPFITDHIGAIYTCMYKYDANHLALRAAIYPNIQDRVHSIWNDSDTGHYLDPSLSGAFNTYDLNTRDAFFLDDDRLKNRIDQIIDGLTGIEHIVTHAPWGEYCHAHHIWVFSFVYEACQRNKINLWVGDFYRIRPHEQTAQFTTISQAQLYKLAYSYWLVGFNSLPNAESRFQRYYEIMRAGIIPESEGADYWTWNNMINESVALSYGTVLPQNNNVYFKLSGFVPEGSGTGHDGEYYSLLDPAGVFGNHSAYIEARKIIRETFATLRDNFPVTGPKFFNGNRTTALISRLLDEEGGYETDNLLNLKISAALRHGDTDYITVERYENNYQEKTARLNPIGEFAPSAYSEYLNELARQQQGGKEITIATLQFLNGTRITYQEGGNIAASFTTMREFIAKLLESLPDVRLVNGEYRLFQNNEMQPKSTTQWHDMPLSATYSTNINFNNVDDFVNKKPMSSPGTGSGSGSRRNGGGFDKNWKIERNVRPITIKLHSPDRFKKPKNSSDFTCSPESAMIAARHREDESNGGQQEVSAAKVIAHSGGNIDATATGNIKGDAGKNIDLTANGDINGTAKGDITLKGSMIFLN